MGRLSASIEGDGEQGMGLVKSELDDGGALVNSRGGGGRVVCGRRR